jgi:hypothetical protein
MAFRTGRRGPTKPLARFLGRVALHTKRMAPLHQGAREELIETPFEVAGLIDKLAERALLSGREDLIAKALAAYLKAHPKDDAGLPKNWQSTVDLARAEIEGKTSGAFEPGFVIDLATAARSELARRAAQEKGRSVGRDGRGDLPDHDDSGSWFGHTVRTFAHWYDMIG